MLAEQREYPHAARPPIGLVLALPTRDPLEGQAPLDCVRQHRLDLKFDVVLLVGDDFGFIFGAHVEQRQLGLTTLGVALVNHAQDFDLIAHHLRWPFCFLLICREEVSSSRSARCFSCIALRRSALPQDTQRTCAPWIYTIPIPLGHRLVLC
jgi:hypothetical protein